MMKMKKLGALLLILIVAGSVPVLARAAAKSFYTNKEVKLKTVEYDEEKYSETEYANYFAEPHYTSHCDKETAPHAHEYTDGVTTKWISAENDIIDGLEKTDKEPILADYYFECTVEEEHAHLYYSPSQGSFIPIYSHDEMIDNEFRRLPMISLLEKEKAELLLKTGMFRAIDQILPINAYSLDNYTVGFIAFLTARPIFIDGKNMIVKNEFVDFVLPFDTNYVDNLMYPYFNKVDSKQKEEISNNYELMIIPIVKKYQKNNIRVPYDKVLTSYK